MFIWFVVHACDANQLLVWGWRISSAENHLPMQISAMAKPPADPHIPSSLWGPSGNRDLRHMGIQRISKVCKNPEFPL